MYQFIYNCSAEPETKSEAMSASAMPGETAFILLKGAMSKYDGF